ncbi:TPA: hypothetical protein DEP21_05390 [Patescibacteria group bacterium]|nr:hypothetical protein [Candidatus Gracilibacteria bacterium]
MYIEGRLRTRKWQDSEGVERFSTEIIVDNFIFLDPKGGNGHDDIDGFDEVISHPEDEEVPF